MEILDRHFILLSPSRKFFLFCIGLGFFLIALLSYRFGIADIIETFLVFAIGMVFIEMLKLEYRIDDLEHHDHKKH